MNIPLIDLKAQYKEIGEEMDKAVAEVLSSANYIMGQNVKSFEKEFSDYLGIKHSISVANGTDALVIALKALGIKAGDEIITTPFTFFSTAESISQVGAIPVFVDVELDTFNIDASKIEEKINSNTKAIMPVHIFGQPCNMDSIMEIAKKHNLKVIEDACQAIGAEHKGMKIGTIGDVACFSFFPTKNLGAAGDGGMIVTNNDEIAVIVRALRAHGSGENGQRAFNLLNHIDDEVKVEQAEDNTIYNPLKYYNYLIGFNSRLDEIQAAILRIKLKYIDEWNNKRRKNADYYSRGLKESETVVPLEAEKCKHVYHMYMLQSERREDLISYLETNGISTGVYYPVPLHLQKVYSGLGYKYGDMPNSEYLSQRTFAIPMFAELTTEQQGYIISMIKKFYND